MKQLLFILWVFAPAGVANMAPVFAARIPWLKPFDLPLDFGRSWRGVRVFGLNKTWRGLLSGMVLATLVLWAQQYLYANVPFFYEISLHVDYAAIPLWLAGPLFGAGALLGDAVESFFKRRYGVPPGHSWFPFDQTDYIIGALLLTWPFLHLSAAQWLLAVVTWLGMHVVVSYAGYLVHLKDKPI